MTAGAAPVSLRSQPLRPLTMWATSELATQGISVCGEAQEMRRRDWTLLARIPTDRGPMWAKSCARGFAHEGPLLLTLHRLAPGAPAARFAPFIDELVDRLRIAFTG